MKRPHRRRPQDHSQCPCMVMQRGPHWGLFCEPHGKYIKWLGARELEILRDLDLPWISESPEVKNRKFG